MKNDDPTATLICVVFENKMTTHQYVSHLFSNLLSGSSYSSLPFTGHFNYYGYYGVENVDTSNAENFESAFWNTFSDPRITSIDAYLPENFNTSKATYMKNMFFGFGNTDIPCKLTLPKSFDMSKVENSEGMFGCIGASTIDISSCTFNSNMECDSMFYTWDNLDPLFIPTYYVKDYSAQQFVINRFNADNPTGIITTANVIIK